MRLACLLMAALATFGAQAATPPPVAFIDRGTWPEALESPARFDVASRAEILMFARALLESEALDETELAERLGLRQINLASINELRGRLWQRLWQNFDRAQQSCGQDASFCLAIDDLDSLKQQAATFAIDSDSFYAGWAAPGLAFHQTYLDELLRLAALAPQISSEVTLLSDLERNGDELPDRLFLLTFDSGPSIAVGGTEGMTDYLRKQKMNATFFVIGQNLQNRADKAQTNLQALYKGQCVGVQGWQYRSHAQWVDWQGSILRSVALVENELPDNYVPLFRPPYGQRRADSREFFSTQKLQVALWDIDSQDDSIQLTAEQSAQRVLTLMLLWRHGVVVFHDTQAKAQSAVPWLLQQTAQSGIGWQDCHDFARAQ
ncbi:polysaccharide deacetylase family protein [Pseudomonas abieticivorans]|uniref:polysaccharide deacetylase family protein n=1 Tax=Pseudomonas abieticivorans TaxID=2931382 RepID=UPI0020BD7015|nr:polysaccharide deacetylase family protein [Pseudomonas sp. PIA16]